MGDERRFDDRGLELAYRSFETPVSVRRNGLLVMQIISAGKDRPNYDKQLSLVLRAWENHADATITRHPLVSISDQQETPLSIATGVPVIQARGRDASDMLREALETTTSILPYSEQRKSDGLAILRDAQEVSYLYIAPNDDNEQQGQHLFFVNYKGSRDTKEVISGTIGEF